MQFQSAELAVSEALASEHGEEDAVAYADGGIHVHVAGTL